MFNEGRRDDDLKLAPDVSIELCADETIQCQRIVRLYQILELPFDYISASGELLPSVNFVNNTNKSRGPDFWGSNRCEKIASVIAPERYSTYMKSITSPKVN